MAATFSMNSTAVATQFICSNVVAGRYRMFKWQSVVRITIKIQDASTWAPNHTQVSVYSHSYIYTNVQAVHTNICTFAYMNKHKGYLQSFITHTHNHIYNIQTFICRYLHANIYSYILIFACTYIHSN
jgi:hypothetical protein